MPNSDYVDVDLRNRIFYPIKDSESFDYKTKLVGKLPDGENKLEDVKIVVPLTTLSNFMFNLEIELILKWS